MGIGTYRFPVHKKFAGLDSKIRFSHCWEEVLKSHGQILISLIATAGLLLLGAAGCSTSEPAPSNNAAPSASSTTGSQDTKPAAPSAVPVEPVQSTAMIQGALVTAEIGPVAVAEDTAVLRLEFESADPISMETYLADPYVHGYGVPSAVQLVDLSAHTVADIAWDDSGPAATKNPGKLGGAPVVYYAVYAAPTDTNIAVLLPGFGLVTHIPVAPAAQIPDLTTAVNTLTDSDTGSLTFPLECLETFTVELDGDLNIRASETGTKITLDSDVLFAADSADLTDGAGASLERVAEHLRGGGDGVLDIVGHTDDVGTHAHNQALSERRAESVAHRLRELVDLSAFDLTVEGRSFDEPAVAKKDAAARAANRRVEIYFAAVTPLSGSQDQELPEPTGPVATGDAGVDVVSKPSDQSFHVTLDQVNRVGDFLVGEIELTNTAASDASLIDIFSGGAVDSRGNLDVTLQVAASKLTLLHGHTRVYPVDYLTPDRNYAMSGGDYKPLSDKSIRSIPAGKSRTVTVVWPAFEAQTVTLDSPHFVTKGSQSDRGGPPFRLTDIPVRN